VLSVAFTVLLPGWVEEGTVMIAENPPSPSVLTTDGIVEIAALSNVIFIMLEAMKPEPCTSTSMPA
jgi:hypothetical protein